jgi:hypothetical protein
MVLVCSFDMAIMGTKQEVLHWNKFDRNAALFSFCTTVKDYLIWMLWSFSQQSFIRLCNSFQTICLSVWQVSFPLCGFKLI